LSLPLIGQRISQQAIAQLTTCVIEKLRLA
jgi:hypothetical protein